jgi:HK97 family phage major capsid protein
MPDLKKLGEDLLGIQKKARDILEAHKDGLTAEKRVEFDGLLTEAKTLKQQIEDGKGDLDREKELKTVTDYLSRPEYKVPHGAVTEPDPQNGRKALLDAGWEIKSGIVMAPTSLGKHVEMFGEDVLWGPLPSDDADASAYFKQMRAAFAPGYREAYTRYIRNAVKVRSESMAYSLLKPDEQKALSEGSDTSGGFLVPPDVQAEMLVRLPGMAVMRRHARVQTTSRDVLKWPMVQPHPTSPSIYSSGFIGGWVGETPAFTDTDPAFGTFDIPIKKIRVATKLSNDFVSDAAVNILGWLSTNGAENMALVEDSGFINGDGGPLQPLGILNTGIATVDVEGSTANTITNTTANAGSAPKIIALAYALPAQYASRGVWLAKRSIEGKIRVLADAQGRYFWPANSGSGFAAVPRDLLGYPIENSDFMPDDGTDGNKVMVYGDLTGYVIGQRAQVTTVVLRERFADTDQVGIILFERVGGAVWNTDAMRIGVV